LCLQLHLLKLHHDLGLYVGLHLPSLGLRIRLLLCLILKKPLLVLQLRLCVLLRLLRLLRLLHLLLDGKFPRPLALLVGLFRARRPWLLLLLLLLQLLSLLLLLRSWPSRCVTRMLPRGLLRKALAQRIVCASAWNQACCRLGRGLHRLVCLLRILDRRRGAVCC